MQLEKEVTKWRFSETYLASVYDNAAVLPRTTLAQMVERNKL